MATRRLIMADREISRGAVVTIASPVYGSQYSATFVHSLFAMLQTNQQLRFRFTYVDYADVTEARNYLISRFYFDHPESSHLLFIDNDMGFDATLLPRMLALNEDVVGVIAPGRHIDLEKLHESADLPFDQALARATRFIGEISQPSRQKQGFIQVNRCGAGILLISRQCMDRMLKTLPELIDANPSRTHILRRKLKRRITPFDPMPEDDSLSEDFAFCHRWVHGCGGEIFASIDSPIAHTGIHTVETKYADREEPGNKGMQRGSVFPNRN